MDSVAYTLMLLKVSFLIRTSADQNICFSPQLIAACHVLLRRLVPRHPSYALISLIVYVDLILENLSKILNWFNQFAFLT